MRDVEKGRSKSSFLVIENLGDENQLSFIGQDGDRMDIIGMHRYEEGALRPGDVSHPGVTFGKSFGKLHGPSSRAQEHAQIFPLVVKLDRGSLRSVLRNPMTNGASKLLEKLGQDNSLSFYSGNNKTRQRSKDT